MSHSTVNSASTSTDSGWVLVLLSGEAVQRHWSLPLGVAKVVGRKDADILLLGRKVSKFCCTLTATSNGVEVVEGVPKFATQVNGVALEPAEKRTLVAGDRLAFGVTNAGPQAELVVRLQSGAMDDTQDYSENPDSSASGYSETEEELSQGDQTDSRLDNEGATEAFDPSKLNKGGQSGSAAPLQSETPTEPFEGLDNSEQLSGTAAVTEVYDPGKEVGKAEPQRKKRMLVLLLAGLVVLLYLFGKDGGDTLGKNKLSIKTTEFSVELVGYKKDGIKNGSYYLKDHTGKYRMVVFTHKYATSGVDPEPGRWMTYQRFAGEICDGTFPLPDGLLKLVWRNGVSDNSSVEVYQVDANSGLRYCECFGYRSKEATLCDARLRFWLYGPDVIVAVAWSEEMPPKNHALAFKKMLDGVQPVEESLYGFYRGGVGNDVEVDTVKKLLESSERFKTDEKTDPANLWRSHQEALQAWQLMADGTLSGDGKLRKEDVWQQVTESAQMLQERFVEKQRQIDNWISLGKLSAVRNACESIQIEIPDRGDMRWLWAETQLINMRSGKKRASVF